MSAARARERADVVVIGGGVIGLAAAWQLARRDAGRVLLLERDQPGHAGGGSHGATRIFRSAYGDARYARLARLARRIDWPALEGAAGRTLLHPRRACFYGPEDGPMADYAAAIGASGAPVHAMAVGAARRRFPELRFAAAGELILDDHSAAVIAAADTMAALGQLARAAGVELRGGHAVRSLRAGPRGVRLAVDAHDPGGTAGRTTADGGEVEPWRSLEIEASAVVVAAGAAGAALLGLPAGALQAVRQWVGYWDAPQPNLPVWAYVDQKPDDFFYGLPALGGEGFKAARHVTRGPGLPAAEAEGGPGGADGERAAGEETRIREMLVRLWAQPPTGLRRHERCVYTMSPDEHFLLGALPGSPRVFAATGGSGHAFKFAPLLGRCVAEMLLDGRASDAETRSMGEAWSPARAALRET